MGVGSLRTGLFFITITLVGTAFAFSTRRMISSTAMGNYPGAVYAVITATIFLFMADLNAALPDGGFGPSLLNASFMCWMISAGSFVLWSDGVRLFQAIPTISLFGMVGLWDTIPSASLFFFIFLLCTVFLLARAHSRQMLLQAEASGFEALLQIRKGPWRQMAGPQWGLGAVCFVILVSLIFAPVLQRSVSPFAGKFELALPQSIIQRRLGTNISSHIANGDVSSVGTGPNKPDNRVVLRALLDQPRYLRENIYDVFDGHDWFRQKMRLSSEDQIWSVDDITYRRTLSQLMMLNPIRKIFAITPEFITSDRNPMPGEVTKAVYVYSNGQSNRLTPPSLALTKPRWEGETLYPNPKVKVRNAYRKLEKDSYDQLIKPTSTPRVRALAREIAAPWHTDYEKAMAIKAHIESVATYNLSAAAVPAKLDRVDYFLFESHEGYCDLFASAVVTMARAVGIPARYATGYYPMKNEIDSDGFTVLRQSDRHAWAELLFEDVGWIPFDATEGARDIDANKHQTTDDQSRWYLQNGFKRTIIAIVAVIILAFLLLLSLGPYKVYRLIQALVTRRPIGADNPKEMRRQVGRLYSSFVRDIGRATGLKRASDVSPTEYALATRSNLGELGPESERLSELYVAAFFAPGSLSEEDFERLKAQTIALRSEIKKIHPDNQGNPIVGAITRSMASLVGLSKVILHLREEDKLERKDSMGPGSLNS
jgi:hypothetical protein